MLKLSEQEKQDIIRYLEADRPLPDKYRFLLFEDKREIIRVKAELSPDEQATFEGMGDTQQKPVGWEEQWTGDYVFENEWQSFRTKKDRSLELISVAHECSPGRHKIAVKVVDIFGNDTMTIVEVVV